LNVTRKIRNLMATVLFMAYAMSGSADAITVSLNPEATGTLVWDDNIGFSQSDRKSDYIYTLNPEMGLSGSTKAMEFKTKYGFLYVGYAKSGGSPRGFHNASAEINYSPLKGILVRVSDKYSIMEQYGWLPETDYSQKVRMNSLTVEGGYSRDLTRRYSVDALYSANYTGYFKNEFARLKDAPDYLEQSAKGTIKYELIPRVKCLTEYRYNNFSFTNGKAPETDSHQMRAGLEAGLGRRLTATGHYGYQWFISANGTRYSGQVIDLTAEGEVAATKTKLKLTVNRLITKDIFAKTYSETSGTLSLSQLLGRRLKATADATLGKYEYQGENKQVTEYRAGCGADYEMPKYFSFGLGYKYIGDKFEYAGGAIPGYYIRDNRVMMMIKVRR
jgi:hypothetical protein